MNRKMHSFWHELNHWIDGEPAHDRSRRIHSPRAAAKEERMEQPESREMKNIQRFVRYYQVAAVLIAVAIVGVLMYTVFHLPLFGSAENPASNEVVTRYVEKGIEETGAVNYVTGMILDYRAFDTFGESSVLFLAVTCVLILLFRDKNNISPEEDAITYHEYYIERETRDPILLKVIPILVPCILLFGIYVVLNGHLSPGGGFSGGAIMGSGLIVYAACFGIMQVRTFFTRKTFKTITTTALLIYAGSKAYSFFTGANGIESVIPLGTPGAILSSGLIFVLDLCVGAIVACTMYGFYALFARGRM
jgi:multicomponent Na+:H+ antiporter subunit B